MVFSVRLATIIGCALLSSTGNAQLPVVTYHCHENLGWSATRYQWHADFYNRNGYNTITMKQFWDWYSKGDPLPPRPMMITVDDNYIKNYTEMYAILQSRNQKAVNFVITTNADGGGLASCDYNKLRELEASGYFEAQSHSQTHPHLAQLTLTQQRTQLQGSRTRLETELSKEVRFHAYPYGDYDSVTISEAQNAGYYAAFVYNNGKSGLSACVYRTSPPYELERLAVDHCATEDELKAKIGFIEALPTGERGVDWTCDDTECAAVFDTAAWPKTTASGTDVYGQTVRRKTASNGDVKAFLWQTVLPKTGQYRIHAKWLPDAANAFDAQYTVTADNKEQVRVMVNQQASAGWNTLGTISVSDKTAPVTVALLDSGTGKLIADAVWFEWLGESPASGVDNWELY